MVYFFVYQPHILKISDKGLKIAVFCGILSLIKRWAYLAKKYTFLQNTPFFMLDQHFRSCPAAEGGQRHSTLFGRRCTYHSRLIGGEKQDGTIFEGKCLLTDYGPHPHHRKFLELQQKTAGLTGPAVFLRKQSYIEN